MTLPNPNDLSHMRHALALGRRGLGQCWPNPSVGAVVVRDGRVIGRGHTAPGGRPHAETQALAQAGDARGATVYVTLEPCAHTGATPPCAQALIDAGVTRVVSALEDPDPRVAGRGHEMLRAAGVRVDLGLCAQDAQRDQQGFLTRIREGRPMVTLKLACSADGRIATASGDSKWITGPLARRKVHALRANHDAVMVGGGTARADDPSLTIRDLGVAHQPVRIVLSRKLDLPEDSALWRGVAEAPLWLCHGSDAAEETRARAMQLGARCILCPQRGRQLAVRGMLEALGKAGLTRVLCEGGGAVAASLLQEDLVDRLIIFSAGLVVGAEGTPAVGAMGLEALQDAPRMRLAETAALGGDVMQVWER